MQLLARSRVPRTCLYQFIRRNGAAVASPAAAAAVASAIQTAKLHASARLERVRNRPGQTASRLAISDPGRPSGPPDNVYRAFYRLVVSQVKAIRKSDGLRWDISRTDQQLDDEIEGFIAELEDAFRLAVDGRTTRGKNPLFHSLRRAFAEGDYAGLYTEVQYAINAHLLREHSPASVEASQRKVANFRYPYEWYPATRAIQRTVHVHVGPTNSGKTYHALQALEAARSGLYAGPLRLLAHEIYSRLTAKGRACALVTGEEVRIPEGTDVYYTSCTVEMTPINRRVDVAVIDEIQLLADPDRGPMWTTAFLGVQAREVHVCGEERAVPILQSLCASTGDRCVIHHYRRLSPLQVSTEALGGWQNLRKGDAVVAFSRVMIHGIKKAIEQQTGRRCAVVYGSLPPEVRAQQAGLFNEPDNDYDFLVASDAIGMGLNLEVKRIVFESVTKFDGQAHKPLTRPEIRQIGGRAGRYRTARQQASTTTPLTADGAADGAAADLVTPGFVTTLESQDLRAVAEGFGGSVAEIESCAIAPPVSVIETFATYYPPSTPLTFILQRIRDMATISSRFNLRIKREALEIASAIQEFPMSITDRVVLLAAPAALKRKSSDMLNVLKALAQRVSQRQAGHLLDIPEIKLQLLDKDPIPGRELDYLQALEVLNQAVTLYLWMSYRFSGIFTSQEVAFQARDIVHGRINTVLDNIRYDPRTMEERRLMRRLKAKREETDRRRREEIMQGDEEEEEEKDGDEDKDREEVASQASGGPLEEAVIPMDDEGVDKVVDMDPGDGHSMAPRNVVAVEEGEQSREERAKV